MPKSEQNNNLAVCDGMLDNFSIQTAEVVEVTVLGDATSAIEWETGEFVEVFNATVDFEKTKLIVKK